MQSGATFELVFACGLVIVHLLSTEDETLLCWGNALLLLDTLLDARDLVVGLNVELNLLAGQGAHFDLHVVWLLSDSRKDVEQVTGSVYLIEERA